jgi:Do/DeqQ family serine protease
MRRRIATPVWLFFLVLLILIFVSGIVGIRWGEHSRHPLFTVSAASDADTVPLNGSFAPVVSKAIPSIVNISSSRVVRSHEPFPFFNDPVLGQFFGGIPREQRERSLGSGVVVSSDGYILTNYHVVEKATDIEVSFGNQDQTPVRVVGTDPQTDLAVVKLDRQGLTPLPLADSSKVEVGDIALAIGDPFGLGRTVTMGIISATGRGNLGIEGEEDFLQTDAAMNPGNSGGALINTRGELIGVNTAILSPTGGNLGIGFAVPSNMARFVLEQIAKSGKVVRGYLGVVVQSITPELAQQFGVSSRNGALISEVQPGGPAEKAGLRRGDIVQEMNGKSLRDQHELQLVVSRLTPGTAINLTILRDGKQQQVPLTLGEQPAQDKTSKK